MLTDGCLNETVSSNCYRLLFGGDSIRDSSYRYLFDGIRGKSKSNSLMFEITHFYRKVKLVYDVLKESFIVF